MRKVIYISVIVLFVVINVLLISSLIISTKSYVDKINRNEIQVESEDVQEETDLNAEEDMNPIDMLKKYIFKVD